MATATPAALTTRQLRRLGGRAVDFLLLPVATGAGPATPAAYVVAE